MPWALALAVPLPPAIAHTLARVEAELEASEPHATVLDRGAPEFSLRDAAGRPIRLADFRGKVVVLHFAEAPEGDPCLPRDRPIARAHALLSAVDGLDARVQLVTVSTGVRDRGEAPAAMVGGCTGGGATPVSWVRLRPGPDRPGAGVELAAAYAAGHDAAPAEEPRRAATYVVDGDGRLRASFREPLYDSMRLMLYVAALAHGEHAPAEEAAATSPVSGVPLQWLLGAVFAVAGAGGYALWFGWSRRRGPPAARDREGNKP